MANSGEHTVKNMPSNSPFPHKNRGGQLVQIGAAGTVGLPFDPTAGLFGGHNMDDPVSEKIDPRLRQCIGYLDSVTVLVQRIPSFSNAALVTQLRGIGGKVTSISI